MREASEPAVQRSERDSASVQDPSDMSPDQELEQLATNWIWDAAEDPYGRKCPAR